VSLAGDEVDGAEIARARPEIRPGFRSEWPTTYGDPFGGVQGGVTAAVVYDFAVHAGGCAALLAHAGCSSHFSRVGSRDG